MDRAGVRDIDTDFSAFAREYAINYVTETYGARAIAGIMTKAVMGRFIRVRLGTYIFQKKWSVIHLTVL